MVFFTRTIACAAGFKDLKAYSTYANKLGNG